MAKSKNYTSHKNAHAGGIEIPKYHNVSSQERSPIIQFCGVYMPIIREKSIEEFVNVTYEMKASQAYDKLRLERTNRRHYGTRLKIAKAKREEKK